MMRRLPVVALLLVLSIGLAAVAPTASAQGGEMIALVNGLRASYGLPGLTPHPALNAAAQAQANWIIATGNWGHVGEGGSSPQNRATAAGYSGSVLENYVGGASMSPQRAVDWWTNSPIHLRAMLATPHEHVGVGFASGDGANVYVLLVGRPVTARPAASSGAGSSGASAEEEAEPEIIAVPVVRAEPRPDGSIVHQVQQGQTVWDLAMVYGVDLGELRALNSLGESMVVHPGDEIMIQLGPGMAPPPTPTVPMSVTVQEGQTLWDIAAIHNVNLDELLWINGMQRGQVVHPGDELMLRLPPGAAPPPTPTPPLTHRVQEGQTAWTVAALYGLTLDELLDLNGMQRPAVVYPGDELLIRQPDPTATPTEAPTAAPTAAPTGTPAPPEPALSPDTPASESGPIIVPTAAPPDEAATPTPAEADRAPNAEPPAADAAPQTPIPPELETSAEATPTAPPLRAVTDTPAAPVSAETGTPVALAQVFSPTPLLASLTPLPTQIVARAASVSSERDTQPYLIGAILVLVGMAALGWMGLMALLRRQQM